MGNAGVIGMGAFAEELSVTLLSLSKADVFVGMCSYSHRKCKIRNKLWSLLFEVGLLSWICISKERSLKTSLKEHLVFRAFFTADFHSFKLVHISENVPTSLLFAGAR